MTSEPHHILLLEDDPTHQKAIAFNLTHAGFRVSMAAESRGALELAKHNHFDLVIADHYLLDELGTDFIKRLREDEDRRHVPVILFTAWAQELNEKYLCDELATLLVSKSCSMAELVETVNESLGMTQVTS